MSDHPNLELQLVATGMHLSRAHGYSVNDIKRRGWTIDATVPWRGDGAAAVGKAIEGISKAIDRLQPDVVMVCGDRVEAFAAATAGHLAAKIVAHVHGGDRALGQFDDALRHAITKLAHVHFAATAQSGRRIARLGEDDFRIHVVGTPGLDQLPPPITKADPATAVVILHPDNADERRQAQQAKLLIAAIKTAGLGYGTVIYPNNDPGWRGIARVWDGLKMPGWGVFKNVPREAFLSLLGSAGVLIGNSSSGIIEAASLGTHVINIGPRQLGRERSKNVVDAPWNASEITHAIAKIWQDGRPKTWRGGNVYGQGNAGNKMAEVLAGIDFDDRLRQKIIAY
ncbi:MAG: UDP-N-acetylglucosamine 2-epimerase [Tepidisphaeraceae bacterium]